MAGWKDEADFMRDIENISDFFISGNHNESNRKFVFKSKKSENNRISTPWYESDSENETEFYSFGRGRNATNIDVNPGEDNHHDRMKEIQMQVRSVIGNRYNNEVIESYYNVCKDDEKSIESPSIAPKEVSISFAKELKKTSGDSEEKLDDCPISIPELAENLDYSLDISTPPFKINGESEHETVEVRKKFRQKRKSPRFYKNKHKNSSNSEDFPPL